MSEQRLSVTFGAFSCDVVGYEDPFAILNRVVELFTEIARENPDLAMGAVRMSEDERAHVATGLADQASRIEEMADTTAVGGARYVFTNTAASAADAASETLEEVVAPVEDQTATGAGDLELHDTLGGSDAPFADEAEMRIPGDPEQTQPVEQTFVDEQAAPAIAEEAVAETAEEPDDTGIEDAVARAVAEFEAPAVDDAQEDAAIETPDIAPLEEAASLEEPVAEETVAAVDAPEVEHVSEPAGETTSLRAPEPVEERRPLRLTMPSAASETETAETAAPETPAAKTETPETEPEKPAAAKPKGLKSTVSVTRLPLRPDNKRPKHEVKKKAQTLTAVQKVEPVVTLSPSIAESATAAADMSRAERLRAKMERRNQDDESDNFLFSDVDEAIREATKDTEATNHDDTLPLTNMLAEVETVKAKDEDPAPAEKKARRSLAGLLGFGKGRRNAEPEDTAEETPLAEEVPTPTTATPRSDGFDRLRGSVAAAMPTTEEAPLPPLELATVSETIDYDDETSPAAFARRVGANTLQDLLEVSAVYMAVVEGKSKFSRRDVMQALNHIGVDKDCTQEARLKSFRKLLTTGSLVRVDDGLFSVSQATRFGYETQLQA